MIVARFADEAGLVQAVVRLRAAGHAVETRTPVALAADEHGPSRLPRVVLAAALLAGGGAFGMQCYATMVSYPQLIGGRPDFFWTSFLIWAVECAVLAATTSAVLGFLIANRLPRYWEPSDACDALRDATLDGWFLITPDDAARGAVSACGPSSLDEVAA